MNKFYTAVGRFQVKGRLQGTRCPQVVIGHQEYILDMQEMLLWSILNWRILEPDELQTHYEAKERETGFLSHRPMEECLNRLIQRGLVANGTGETAADALYDLLSELYIVPISESPLLRIVSFIKLTVFQRVPFSVTKKIFGRDKRSEDEKKVMRLANQMILSTAEIVKCFQQKTESFVSEEHMMDILYRDEYATSDNLAFMVRYFPECRPVVLSVANLYLRKQIIFERI